MLCVQKLANSDQNATIHMHSVAIDVEVYLSPASVFCGKHTIASTLCRNSCVYSNLGSIYPVKHC